MSREKVLTINLSFPHTQGKTRQLALSKIDLEFILARYYSDLAGARVDSIEVEMSELEKSALSKEREKQVRKEMVMELSNELLDKINNLCYNRSVNRMKEVTTNGKTRLWQRRIGQLL